MRQHITVMTHLIQYKDTRVFENGTCDGDSLSLPARKLDTSFSDGSVEPEASTQEYHGSSGKDSLLTLGQERCISSAEQSISSHTDTIMTI